MQSRKRGDCYIVQNKNRYRILEIDLSTQEVASRVLEHEVVQKFIGGLGLGIKILYDEVGPAIDALSPDNVVIVAAGLLSGTTAPTNGRADIVTKSPLTGIMGRGNFGGWWGPRLKRAGFEAIVIRGKAESPVYLWIDNGTVEVRQAEHLWGKDTWQTISALKGELGSDVSVLAIGPAGENLVRFACPIADYDHAPGRSHAGCVMGFKKLKAIAVRGTGDVPIVNPEKFSEAVKEVITRIAGYPGYEDRAKAGSSGLLRTIAESGELPCNNYQSGVLPPESDIWSMPESAKELLLTSDENEYGYHCPLAEYHGCNLRTDIKTGPYAGLDIGGMGFSQPGWDWGAKCGITSMAAMWKCRELCNRYGMDTVGPVSFAMELYQKNIITRDDLGGIELNWGNEEAIMALLGKIAHREDFGDMLAEGSVRTASMLGHSARQCLVTVKGMEIIMRDPRVESWARLLGDMVGPRGDDLDSTHGLKEGYPSWAKRTGWTEQEYLQWHIANLDMFADVKAKIFEVPPKTESLYGETASGKASLVIWYEQLRSLFNSLGLCLWPASSWNSMGPTHYAKLYSAYTGWNTTAEELMKTGDRIFTLMRAYGAREGITRKDDDVPARFYEVPLPDGPRKGAILAREKVSRLLDEYYELRGWNRKTGIPTREKLAELELDFVASELGTLGILPE